MTVLLSAVHVTKAREHENFVSQIAMQRVLFLQLQDSKSLISKFVNHPVTLHSLLIILLKASH